MPKKHHYVPVTYLNEFVDASGSLRVYRKDAPGEPFRQKPEATGFEKYYYAQTDAEGTRDSASLEAKFSEVETHWPKIIDALRRRESAFVEAPQLIVFVALMRVRGPAFRDAAELHLSDLAQADLRVLMRTGDIPPPPPEVADRMDELEIAIDPHMSLLAMPRALNGVAEMLEVLSFDVLHNQTGASFLTSDNPVVYYDSRRVAAAIEPYNVEADFAHVELLMPLSKDMMLRGRSRPRRSVIGHKVVRDRAKVRQLNRLIARFAYKTVFAADATWEELIAQHAALSPVPSFEHIPAGNGSFRLGQMVFGPRVRKPKWER